MYAYFNYLNIIPCVRDSHVKLHESFEIVPSRRAKLYLSHSRDIIHINQSYLFLISIFYDSFKLCWEICPRMIELKTDDTKYPKSYKSYSWFDILDFLLHKSSNVSHKIIKKIKEERRRNLRGSLNFTLVSESHFRTYSSILRDAASGTCRRRAIRKKNWTISSGMANDGKRSAQGFRNDSNHWSKQHSINKCAILVHFQFRIIQREKEKKQVEILERCSFLSHPSKSFEMSALSSQCLNFRVFIPLPSSPPCSRENSQIVPETYGVYTRVKSSR